MPRIEELKEKVGLKTFHLVLLSLVSMGVYDLLYIDRVNRLIKETTGHEVVSSTFVTWICVLIGISYLGYDDAEPGMLALFVGIVVASRILMIIWAFKARRILVDYAREAHRTYLSTNGFYTFIFNNYYINYCINDLPMEAMRGQVVRGS